MADQHDQRPSIIAWLEDFVAGHFPDMPPALRAIVYFMLVVTLVWAIARVIGGEYAVHGRIFVKTADGKTMPARNFDVQIDDRFYGTNSKGLYYVILTPVGYSELLATRSLGLTVAQGDDSWAREPKFHFFSKLDDVTIDLSSPSAAPAQVSRSFQLIPSAYASGLPPTDRLFVEGIDLQGLASVNVEEATLTLAQRSGTRSLETPSHKSAGALPLIGNRALDFGSRYYFAVAPNEPAVITLTADTGYFSSYEEKFTVPLPLKFGIAVACKGDHGGRISVRQLSPVDVTVWSRADNLALVPTLQRALAADGIRVVAQESPLGDVAETNTVFIGSAVPYRVAQKVLQVLQTTKVPLKSIKYDHVMKSGNSSEIQIGSTKHLERAAAISPQKLQQAITAQNVNVFRASVLP